MTGIIHDQMSSIPVIQRVYHDSSGILFGPLGHRDVTHKVSTSKLEIGTKRLEILPVHAGRLGNIRCNIWWNWHWMKLGEMDFSMELRGSHWFASFRVLELMETSSETLIIDCEHEMASANIPINQPEENNLCVCVSLSCIMTISLSWGCHQQQHHDHQHHCHVSVIILIDGITAIIMRVYINSRHHGRVQATSHGCTCKNHVQIMFNTQWHETQLI